MKTTVYGLTERLFRPHVHTNSCRICAAADALRNSRVSYNQSYNSPSTSAVTDETRSTGKKRLTAKDLKALPTTAHLMSGTTVQEWRQAALVHWETHVRPTSLTTADEDWFACNGGHQAERESSKRLSPVAPREDLSTSGVSDPLLVVPPVVRLAPEKVIASPQPLNKLSERGLSSDEFLDRVRRAFPGNLAEVERQLRYREALLDFRRLSTVPFFLSFGTALAAHREGYFIVHDNDIDVGVFVEDLASEGRQRVAESNVGADPLLEGTPAQRAVLGLLESLTNSGCFVTFDVCGTVEMGLELRLLHLSTSTRLDINVHYPPIPDADNYLLDVFGGPFIWSATYYEQASQRKYGMYRHRHSPFRDRLERTTFCLATSNDNDTGFAVPPVSYLSEYYGVDWGTPKAYSYEEGLRSEYKTIIPE